MTLHASDDSIDIVSIHPTIHIDSLAHMYSHTRILRLTLAHTHTHTHTQIHKYTDTHNHPHTHAHLRYMNSET